MKDRGETIVRLARELLDSDLAAKKFSPQPMFKALVFTALLAALGGSLVTQAFDNAQRPIGAVEKNELEAFLYYTAAQRGVSLDALRQDLAAKKILPSSSLTNLTAHDYQNARDHLVSKLP